MENCSRITVWILGDQLLLDHPALRAAEQETDRANIRVLLVESKSRKQRLPYQRRKLVLLISAMRHYAEKLRSMGYAVNYVYAPDTLAGLRQHAARHAPGKVLTMAAAEYAGRMFQQERMAKALGLPVTVLPNTQFLLGRFNPMTAPDSRSSTRAPIMERFYRIMRRHFDVLLDTMPRRWAASGILTARTAKRCPKAAWT